MKPIVDSLKVLGESTKTFESLRDNLFAPKKMKFNSQISTTREQSERLLALGLKKETADMKRPHYNKHSAWVIAKEDCLNEHWLPAWSLHRLIEMMPMYFKETKIEIRSEAVKMAMKDGNLYDNLIDIIADCIKEGCFNKEYLV